MMAQTAGLVALAAGAVALLACGLCVWTLRSWWQAQHGRAGQEEASEAARLLQDTDRSAAKALKGEKDGRNGETESSEREALPAEGAAEEKPAHDRQSAGSILELEVVAGPVVGLKVRREVVGPPWPVVTVGRVGTNLLTLNDPEVSSKHALVAWNPQLARWQVVDKGSLNGTAVNSEPIGAAQGPDAGARQQGDPVSIANGDLITIGSASRLQVRIEDPEPSTASRPGPPFPVAITMDAMTARKGGKPLPMEDVPMVVWPLKGVEDFGVFCVFDGHAGRAGALNASRIMPEKLSALLLDQATRSAVLRECNASDVLREAFSQTESDLPNEDEGCTATVLLVWQDELGFLVVQAANVGDSHCVLSLGGQQMVLTEDHRLTGPVERARLAACGKALKEGETRLCGMNIARVLGDKFLKSQDVGLSAEPHISQAVQLGDGFDTFAIIARHKKKICLQVISPEYEQLCDFLCHFGAIRDSDGLWDVLSTKRAIQLAAEAKAGNGKLLDERGFRTVAEAMSEALVSAARRARTQDNTCVLAVDFQAPKAA